MSRARHNGIDAETNGVFAREKRLVDVMLPLPLPTTFSYYVPDGLEVDLGDFVLVPLGQRDVIAVIWANSQRSMLDPKKIKPILKKFACPPLPKGNRDFIAWVADYVMRPAGLILKMAMPIPKAILPPKPELGVVLNPKHGEIRMKMTPARQSVFAVMAQNTLPVRAMLIAEQAKVSIAVVKNLVKLGYLEEKNLSSPHIIPPKYDHHAPTLNTYQQRAAEACSEAVSAQNYVVQLLEGVTGSGKTEVYFEAIAACLRIGRQALILLPEIALSAQWVERFEHRFGVKPALWHSDISHARKRKIWRDLIEGRSSILVGARSALHLPLKKLGLIIVDEEHDPAYKQEEGIIYHARDMAVVRGHIAKCPVILVSATPSLETIENVKKNRYQKLEIPERHGGAQLPEIIALDLTQESHAPKSGQWLSPQLVDAVKTCLMRGEQAVLFLNRRGYAPLTLCRQCGHRMMCQNCSAWLVEHRFSNALECHHCGFSMPMPTHCPNCQAQDSFVACGPGVERLAEEVALRLPEARSEIITSESISGPDAAQAFVNRMIDGTTNLVIGTQIIAKGYHFPNLTLVGVVDADLGLYGGDLRAGERTYQLLHQVAGRAGRAARRGQVILQTRTPSAPVIAALMRGDQQGFLEAEANMRKQDGYPPFGRLAAFIVSGRDQETLDHFVKALARVAPNHQGLTILGPADAPLKILRGRHRRRFLIRCESHLSSQKIIKNWLSEIKLPASLRLEIDIDPYNFM